MSRLPYWAQWLITRSLLWASIVVYTLQPRATWMQTVGVLGVAASLGVLVNTERRLSYAQGQTDMMHEIADLDHAQPQGDTPDAPEHTA